MHLVERRVKNMSLITFINEDFKAPDLDQDDQMVITIELSNYGIGKVLVDQDNLVIILY